MTRNLFFSIAVSSYRHWTSLTGPCNDEAEVWKVLRDRFGFEPYARLLNETATWKKIREHWSKLISLEPSDNLIIYYSGHGWKTRLDELSFWIPHDAAYDSQSPEENQNQWMNVLGLLNILRNVKCRHILIISDSCFSGDILNLKKNLDTGRPPGYPQLAHRFKSREVLTSGRSEYVADANMGKHSAFAYHLIDALRSSPGPYLDAHAIYGCVRNNVYGQHPQYGPLYDFGHQQGGALILIPQDVDPDLPTEPLEPSAPRETMWLVKADGWESVPMTLDMLKREIRTGHVPRDMQVRCTDRPRWIAAGQVPELADAFPSSPPACRPSRRPNPRDDKPRPAHRRTDPEHEFAPGTERRLLLPHGVELVLCWCPATTSVAWKRLSGGDDFFWMGSPPAEIGRDPSETFHRVRLTRGFWIGKCPVTQRQWRAASNHNPSQFQSAGLNAPVEQVNWAEIQQWLLKANEAVREAVPSGISKGLILRLPTEAEWEHACRAGATSALYSGLNLTTAQGKCPNLDALAWYLDDSASRTHPVGRRAPNAWGLHDMLGNVWEWCDTWLHTEHRDLVEDPTGPAVGTQRVRRGGCWFSPPSCARAGSRAGSLPSDRGSGLGFRLACD